MCRFCKALFGFLLVLLFAGGIASMFPATKALFNNLPYWLLYPLRTTTTVFLVFIFTGYLLDSGIPQKIFRKK